MLGAPGLPHQPPAPSQPASSTSSSAGCGGAGGFFCVRIAPSPPGPRSWSGWGGGFFAFGARGERRLRPGPTRAPRTRARGPRARSRSRRAAGRVADPRPRIMRPWRSRWSAARGSVGQWVAAVPSVRRTIVEGAHRRRARHAERARCALAGAAGALHGAREGYLLAGPMARECRSWLPRRPTCRAYSGERAGAGWSGSQCGARVSPRSGPISQ